MIWFLLIVSKFQLTYFPFKSSNKYNTWIFSNEKMQKIKNFLNTEQWKLHFVSYQMLTSLEALHFFFPNYPAIPWLTRVSQFTKFYSPPFLSQISSTRDFFLLPIVLVSFRYCNISPQMSWFRTTHISYIAILWLRSLKWYHCARKQGAE